jgi:hypothetical protein
VGLSDFGDQKEAIVIVPVFSIPVYFGIFGSIFARNLLFVASVYYDIL